MLRLAAGVAIVFGALTVYSGCNVLFDNACCRREPDESSDESAKINAAFRRCSCTPEQTVDSVLVDRVWIEVKNIEEMT